MAVRRQMIRELAEKLLAECAVKRGPVPVESICRSQGIKIKLNEVDDDLSGFLYRANKDKKTFIGANKAHHKNRQRFTIAHELGHYFLHEGEMVHLDEQRDAFMINLRSPISAKGEDNDEKEANLFAAELLMPAQFLKDELKDKDVDLLSDDKFLGKLAKKYKVSLQALTFRLANLGYIKV